MCTMDCSGNPDGKNGDAGSLVFARKTSFFFNLLELTFGEHLFRAEVSSTNIL